MSDQTISALISAKYAYFSEPGLGPNRAYRHYVQNYTCSATSISQVRERFDRAGYKLALEDHNFTYELKIAYDVGNSDGTGLMVRSFGAVAMPKVPGSKEGGGILFETTPHYMAPSTGGGSLVYQFAMRNRGVIPEAIDKCLRICSGYVNFLNDRNIPMRGCVSTKDFIEAFGRGNEHFLLAVNMTLHDDYFHELLAVNVGAARAAPADWRIVSPVVVEPQRDPWAMLEDEAFRVTDTDLFEVEFSFLSRAEPKFALQWHMANMVQELRASSVKSQVWGKIYMTNRIPGKESPNMRRSVEMHFGIDDLDPLSVRLSERIIKFSQKFDNSHYMTAWDRRRGGRTASVCFPIRGDLFCDIFRKLLIPIEWGDLCD